MFKPIIIYIEGNIGSGKSTFAEQFQKHLNIFGDINQFISVIQEPVDEWQEALDSDGKNILEKFYEDIDRWSFTFQMNSFISRTKKIQDEVKNYKGLQKNIRPVLLVERSIYTDRNVFAVNCYENGKMKKIEYDIYCKWNDWLSEQFDLRPDGYIYLRCDPKINNERIIKRSRNGESQIPIQYLEQIHTKHEQWLDEEYEYGIPILTLDATENFLEKEKMNQFSEQVFKFIDTLKSNLKNN